MKSNDPRITTQHLDLTSDNTFISNPGSDFLQNMQPFITSLNAQNQTVIITDPYLFPTPQKGGSPLYYQKLEQLLSMLMCNRIIYTMNPMYRTGFRNVKTALSANGIQLDIRTISFRIHDRFWICAENQNGFSTGTSPNGMISSLCQITPMSHSDAVDLLAKFGAEQII